MKNKISTSKQSKFENQSKGEKIGFQSKFRADAGAVTAIAPKTRSAHVQVKITRPTEIANLRRAGNQVAQPTWGAFMEKPLVTMELKLENITDTTNAYAQCLMHALALRDLETAEHTRRVTELTLGLARAMNISEDEMIHIRYGAMLHDVGKIGIPDSIFYKATPLTRSDWDRIKMHPVHAYEMLSIVPDFRFVIDIPHCHHEKWDGTGYPRQLKGSQIPLSARVFTIVDVWDALLSNRPYRFAWSVDRTIEYIHYQSGKLFDPEIVRVFMEKTMTMAFYYDIESEILRGAWN